MTETRHPAPSGKPDTCLAVINAGSSSIKFALYGGDAAECLLFRGQVEQIGVAPRLHVVDGKGAIVAEQQWAADGFDHRAATGEIIKTATGLIRGTPVAAVGHRVVHGGMKYSAPVRINPEVIAELARLAPLAPLHQPHNLAPIQAIAGARAAASAGGLLRHRFPSLPAGAGAALRPAARIRRRGHPALRLSRPVL